MNNYSGQKAKIEGKNEQLFRAFTTKKHKLAVCCEWKMSSATTARLPSEFPDDGLATA
jgi:hypothetical protein